MKCYLGSDNEIVSPSDFGIWTHAYSFPKLMVFYFGLVEMSMYLENVVDWVEKEDKVVGNYARGKWIPMTRWRVEIIMEIIVIRMWVWVVLIRIRPTRCMWLVHIVKRRVGIIRIEWSLCEIWIHVRIERIIIVECHFTQKITNKKKPTNKQTKKKKF